MKIGDFPQFPRIRISYLLADPDQAFRKTDPGGSESGSETLLGR